MAEKTLGQVAFEAAYADMGETYEWDRIPMDEHSHWQAAANAAIQAHEARRWQAIESAPRTRQYILAYSPERKMSFQVCWDHEWGYWQMRGGGKCTMEFTLWTPIPAPPKEAKHGS